MGKEKDSESGLYYYGARYYSAWTCRFISIDPLASTYKQLTPYNYAANDPVGDLDIDGMQNEQTAPDQAENSASDRIYKGNALDSVIVKPQEKKFPESPSEGQVHISTDVLPFSAPNNMQVSGTDGTGISIFWSDQLDSMAWVYFGDEAGWQAWAFETNSGDRYTWNSDQEWYVNGEGEEFDDHMSMDTFNMVGSAMAPAVQAFIDKVEKDDALYSFKGALDQHGGSLSEFMWDGVKKTASDIGEGGHKGKQALGSMYMGILSSGPSFQAGGGLIYNGTIRGSLKHSLSWGKKLGGSSSKVNYYTLLARELNLPKPTTFARSKAGFFVQVNHNLGRLFGGKKLKLLYSASPTTMVGRAMQNRAIGTGLGMGGFGLSVTYLNGGVLE